MSGSHQGQEHPHLNGLDNPGISVVPPTPSGRRPLFPGDSLRETQREGDLEKSGSASQRAPSPYTRSVTEAEKTQKEIDVVLGMVRALQPTRLLGELQLIACSLSCFSADPIGSCSIQFCGSMGALFPCPPINERSTFRPEIMTQQT